MGASSEVAFFSRALKAPRIAALASSLAERARSEGWDYEQYLAQVLSEEVSSRESHGGENRVKAARLPQVKTLDDFDFSFQRSVKRQQIAHRWPSSTSCARPPTWCSWGRRARARPTVRLAPRFRRGPVQGSGRRGGHDSKSHWLALGRCSCCGSVCSFPAGTAPGPSRCWPDQKPVRLTA